ncbi:hypothetical protein HHX47_DHR2000511 [Lentinula edodes]|nr:hypothetical protein HHX47_DHR2000511 [Lentinula edodes]
MGTTFLWKLGSPFSTYPFGIHSGQSDFNPGYVFATASEEKSTITIRSKSRSDYSMVIDTNYPCGFCGQPCSLASCSVQIDKGYVQSRCPYAYRVQIWRAATMSIKNPATNVPLTCPFSACREVHWKYNMKNHLLDRHPGWKNNVSSAVAAEFDPKFMISREEELALGIPSDKVGVDHVATVTQVAKPPQTPFKHSSKRPDPPADGVTPRRMHIQKRTNVISSSHEAGATSTNPRTTSNEQLLFAT